MRVELLERGDSVTTGCLVCGHRRTGVVIKANRAELWCNVRRSDGTIITGPMASFRLLEDFGPHEPLRLARKSLGLSLRETARQSLIEVAHLSRVERGQASLSIAALRRLADVLELGELSAALDATGLVKT